MRFGVMAAASRVRRFPFTSESPSWALWAASSLRKRRDRAGVPRRPQQPQGTAAMAATNSVESGASQTETGIECSRVITPPPSPREAALALAVQHGIAPMPLLPQSKRPAQSAWQKQPSPTAVEIAAWSPNGNIGFRCGSMSGGLVVIDVDPGADALLSAWGSTGGAADIDADGTVGASDLAAMLNAWGACPA